MEKKKIGGAISLESCPTKYLNIGLKDAFSYGAAVILDISRAGPQGRKWRTRKGKKDTIPKRTVIWPKEVLVEVAKSNPHLRRTSCLGRAFLKAPLELLSPLVEGFTDNFSFIPPTKALIERHFIEATQTAWVGLLVPWQFYMKNDVWSPVSIFLHCKKLV